MMDSDKNGYLEKTNSDPNSPYLIHRPPLDDLKNDCTKNLFIHFLLRKCGANIGV